MEPLKMTGTWVPCPPETLCRNCDHPLAGHWQQNPRGFATGCRECDCDTWYCVHGGRRT